MLFDKCYKEYFIYCNIRHSIIANGCASAEILIQATFQKE